MPTEDLPHIQRTSMAYLTATVARRVLVRLTEVMAAEGLTRNHFTLLSALAEFGPVSQSELARRTGLNAGHLVGFLDDLEGIGALQRRPDPADRRRNAVELTAQGDELVARATAAERHNEEVAFGALSASEQETLRALLTKVLDHPVASEKTPE
ncbi:MarR family winged helix-turn-helix transcriptional regulator [Nocardioides sp.]|uniref:MarR family winged helix-turn-helix transcriptional regulator n=1 Tax=Nocardioides sp. TaxID=35761 RepID=UPI00262CC037|nr:MarR family winged helix-turn-helix transcriptional regulator [Nocardioides sp.]